MIKNMEDCLVIGFDSHPLDIDTMVVARKSGEKLVIINVIRGSEAVEIYNKLIGNKTNHKNKKKRKYYRKCGICGERFEQSEMIRTNQSSNGWLCFYCHNAEHPEYDD